MHLNGIFAYPFLQKSVFSNRAKNESERDPVPMAPESGVPTHGSILLHPVFAEILSGHRDLH
jgi:hypothetical protein